MEVLAQRLAALRAERGESYERVAAQLGVTMKIVKKWERGEGRPSVENLLRLVQFYDVSADYLLGDTDDPQRRPRVELAAALADSADSTQMREAGDEAVVLGERRRATRRSKRSRSAPKRPAGSEEGR